MKRWRASKIVLGAALFVLFAAAWYRSERILPAPEGIPDRYVLHVGPMLFAGVEDTKTREMVLWYDLDSGPDLKRIERLDNGNWVVVLAPRQ